MMRVRINKSKAFGKITAQPSKSYSHRLLIGAALSRKELVIENVVLSNDIKATIRCLNELGISVIVNNNIAYIKLENKELKDELIFDCGESGSTLRFFIPIALTTGKKLIFKGTEKLISRGIGPYEEIFKVNNIKYSIDKDSITIEGKLESNEYYLPGNISSQFITGMLYALSLLDKDSKIILTTNLESSNYVDMTIDVLRKFNVIIDNINIDINDLENNAYIIKGGQSFDNLDNKLYVEGDYSNAAFIDAFNYISGNVLINGLNEDSYQGDKVYKDLFEKLSKNEEVIDISNCIDLGPILFCMASLKHGAHFINTSRLKIKESDRVLDLKNELEKFGVEVTDLGNEVIINNKNIKAPKEELDGHNDHRLVMSLSVMLSVYGGVIRGTEAVNKSYPSFFDDLARLGIEVKYE